MKSVWRNRLWRSAAICTFGSAALVLLASGCFRIGLNTSIAGFPLLIVIALLSLVGGYFESVVLAIVATGCVDYFFTEPVLSLQVDSIEDVVAMAAFLTTSLIITGLTAKVRRAAAEELRQTRAELARFARVAALGELTASIAHEVNQPLAAVVSSGNACLRWLASDPPNVEKASQSASRIIRDANRASDVVQRVRSLVKNAPPEKAWVNMNDAILEIIVLSRHEAEEHRVSLRTHLAEDAPPVWADRVQLQQVVMNLVTNAVEAMKAVEGGPRDLLISTERNDTSSMRAAITDSGPGLDPDKLHDMFDAFYTTKSDGMGMGLAISRSIIEAHGGQLWATANKPRGAVFHFTLPTVQGEAA